MSADAERFTLATLVARTGVAAPTIHQYRRLGLLPEPVRGRSNRFLYDTRHVRALDTIRRLRHDKRLPLDIISQVLPTLLAKGVDRTSGEEWDLLVSAELREVDPTRPPARLLAVARESFAAAGYDDVSVGDICLAAGIAKGSFYRYFSSKEDAFLTAARSIVDVVGDALAAGPEGLDEDATIQEVGAVVAPMVPLFLEVVLRALHGAPDHAEVVSDIISGIGLHAARRAHIDDSEAEDEGSRLTEAALAYLLRARFEPNA